MDILTSLHGKKIGLDKDGNLVIEGTDIILGNGTSAPLRVGTSNPFVATGATLTLTVADHAGKTILLNTAAGSVVTLPAATGSGARFRFLVSVLATSNSHIVKVANASDTMMGGVTTADTDTSGAASSFFAAATHDTITLNRSTMGSVSLGEWFELQDVAANKWAVSGQLSCTGAPTSPFSATVS